MLEFISLAFQCSTKDREAPLKASRSGFRDRSAAMPERRA